MKGREDMKKRSTQTSIKKILYGKKGMGTVEVVIIIAILVALALIFRTTLMSFARNIMDTAFDDQNVINQIAQ